MGLSLGNIVFPPTLSSAPCPLSLCPDLLTEVICVVAYLLCYHSDLCFSCKKTWAGLRRLVAYFKVAIFPSKSSWYDRNINRWTTRNVLRSHETTICESTSFIPCLRLVLGWVSASRFEKWLGPICVSICHAIYASELTQRFPWLLLQEGKVGSVPGRQPRWDWGLVSRPSNDLPDRAMQGTPFKLVPSGDARQKWKL